MSIIEYTKHNLSGYDLTAGIHTISIKTTDSVTLVPEITYYSKNPLSGITSLRINVNKSNGFILSYSNYMQTLNDILDRAGIKSYTLVRVDMCFDSYDTEHYSRFAKLNRLLISMVAQAYCVRNKYRTTDLFTNKQLSVAVKNPNSFEIENYDKAFESHGKDRAKSRFEIRSTRMKAKTIPHEFIDVWNSRLTKAAMCFEETLARYNSALIDIYHEENKKGNGIKWSTFFRMYENCIFTRDQAIDLLRKMNVKNPEESYKYFKKTYKLETYSRKDVEFAICEIQRARDIFFFSGAEKSPLLSAIA